LEDAAVLDSAHICTGAQGNHVVKIQLALIQLDGASIDADGRFGPATAAAVLAYKRVRNIINRAYQQQPDSIVGKTTVASLDAEMLQRETSYTVATVQAFLAFLYNIFLGPAAKWDDVLGPAKPKYQQSALVMGRATAVNGANLNSPFFGLVSPFKPMKLPVPPFLQSAVNNLQFDSEGNPAAGAALAALLLSLLVMALLIDQLKAHPDKSTPVLVREMEKMKADTQMQAIKQEDKTRQEIRAKDATLEECRAKNPEKLKPGGKCEKLAEAYDAAKAEVNRRLTAFKSNSGSAAAQRAANEALDKWNQAFAALKACLGCNF
jgi:hypothetical protein